jgi:hypothetical protein
MDLVAYLIIFLINLYKIDAFNQVQSLLMNQKGLQLYRFESLVQVQVMLRI